MKLHSTESGSSAFCIHTEVRNGKNPLAAATQAVYDYVIEHSNDGGENDAANMVAANPDNAEVGGVGRGSEEKAREQYPELVKEEQARETSLNANQASAHSVKERSPGSAQDQQ